MRFSKKRYRRKVAFFKISSGLALGLIIALICYNLLGNKEAEKVTAEDKKPANYGVLISDSMFEGSDKHGKNYQLASKTLIKAGENIYDLETIEGKYSLGHTDVDFKASNGKMDDDSKLLKLLHNIVIEYSEYLLMTDQMDIDLTKMSAQNNRKVSVLYHNSNIKADRFTLDTDSDTIHFEGNVLTHFKISDF